MAKPNKFRMSRFSVSADRAAFGDLRVQRYAFSVDQHRPSVDKLLPGTVVFLVAAQRREGKEELHGLGFAGRRQFARQVYGGTEADPVELRLFLENCTYIV